MENKLNDKQKREIDKQRENELKVKEKRVIYKQKYEQK